MRVPLIAAALVTVAAGCQCFVPVADPACQFPCRRSEECVEGACQPRRGAGVSDGGGLDAGSDAGRGVDAGSDAGTTNGDDAGACASCDAGQSCAFGSCFTDSHDGGLGAACTSSADCRVSPSPLNNTCLADADGWPRGYCTTGCSTQGFDPACGGGLCILPGLSSYKYCLALCSTIGGQGECRPGYLCVDRNPGTSTHLGTCQPSCKVVREVCDFYGHCSDAGFCEP